MKPKERGNVIAGESLTRACGCEAIFCHYENDPFRAERRAKFLAKRCGPCGRQASEEHNRKVAAQRAAEGKPPKKGKEVKMLPDDSTYFIIRQNSRWYGTLQIGRIVVKAEANGLMSVIAKLAAAYFKGLKTDQAGRSPA